MNTYNRYLPILFLAILLLVPFGFSNYLERLFGVGESKTIIHFHFVLMSVWCVVLLLQPILIVKKQHQLHKAIGKLTLFLMPMVMVALYLTINLTVKRSTPEVMAARVFMPFFHMIIFGLFYILAMKKGVKRDEHLRFIIISSLALFGPTIGRIDFGILSDIKGGLELLLIDLMLIAFLVIDYRKKQSLRPFMLGLVVYGFVHLGSLTIARSETWGYIVTLLFPI